jgi:hypothetical protein
MTYHILEKEDEIKLKEKYINVFKNKYNLKSNVFLPRSKIKLPTYNNLERVIVFDLDETIGSFHHLIILWNSILQEKDQNMFNEILDLYPEFLRYGILQILRYIIKKKKKGECNKLYMYTNNIYSPEFPNMISKYLQYKLNCEMELFDKIILAFKVNNKVIEPLRTTYNKTYNDLIKCTLLPDKTEICFIDDNYYEKMNNEKVYYIQPKPYYHTLSIDEILDRFLKSNIVRDFQQDSLYKIMQNNEYNIIERENDLYKKVFQKLMYYVKDFFYLTNKRTKTKKIQTKIGNFTRKIINVHKP